MQNKSRHYWMTQYNQSWFKNIWINRSNAVTRELWQEGLRKGPKTFEYPLNLIVQNKKVTQE